MLISPLPVAPIPSPIPASDGTAVGASGVDIAGESQVAQDSGARGAGAPGVGALDANGRSGTAKASTSGSDANKQTSQTTGADFAQALAASLSAQSPQPMAAAPTQGEPVAAPSPSSVASGANAFAALLASGAGPAVLGSDVDGTATNPPPSPTATTDAPSSATDLSTLLGLDQPQTGSPQPAAVRSAPGPGVGNRAPPASDGKLPTLASATASPGNTSATPNDIAQTAADSPRLDGAQIDQGANADPSVATGAEPASPPTPSPPADASGAFAAATPGQPSQAGQAASGKTAPLSANVSARSLGAKPTSGKADAAAGAAQAGAVSSGPALAASVDALAASGGQPKNSGGDAPAQTAQTAQTDDSAAQTAAPVQSDPSALAAALQAQSAPAALASAPKADAQTVSQLSARIVQTVTGAKSSFDLTLHPEGLGDVQVKVSVDRNGAVTAAMSFNNPQAAAELGARAGDLRDALSQAGFTVADNGLSFNMSGQGQSGAGQGGWSQGADPSAGRAFLAARDNSEDLLAAVSQAAANLQRPSAAGLDIRI